MDPKKQRASAIRFIVCLGVVSLFADMAYEGARSIIGPFFKDLGATAAQVGLIAGLGEMPRTRACAPASPRRSR